MSKSGWNGLGRAMKILFVASLALNLLIIGAITTLAVKWHRHGGLHHWNAGIEFNLVRFARTLPKDRRRELRKIFEREREKLKPSYSDIHEARLAVAESLLAEPFDRDRLATVLTKARGHRSKIRDDVSGIFLDIVDKLSAKEKRQFGQFMKKKRRHRWRRWRRDGHKEN